MPERYAITTPIYYVNGSPHIGHAYTSLAADVMARWKRLDGFDVFFLTGTDEHGQKVEQAALAAGLAPLSFVDRVADDFRHMADRLAISYDDFIRTTEPRHQEACAALWQRLEASGQIYEGAYEGWYALRDEAFYGEDELTLHPDGSRVAPTGAPVSWVREPSFFFRLSAWGGALLAHYERHPEFIGPASRRNEVIAFVRQGLRDLSISRTSFSWGVPVPGHAGHVMYVWWDALINYITALGYPDPRTSRWSFWPVDLHLVGKEIARFHAIYWPAMLMAAGLELPRRVYSHGWWTIEGQKMSKSVGNVIDPLTLVEEFGLDPVRFYLLREVPFGSDGDYSRQSLINRLNTELANDLGNLAQRTLSLTARNASGVLPGRGTPSEEDRSLLDQADALHGLLREQVDRQALHEMLESVWQLVRASNAYIDRQAPWALRRTDNGRMLTVLRILVDVLRTIATLLQPFMPASMASMLDQLGVPEDARNFAALAAALPDGSALPPPHPIFPRLVDTNERAAQAASS